MGLIQIRLVAGVYILFGVISVATLLMQVILQGTPFNPATLLPSVLWVGLAVGLLMGSKLARRALAVLSAISAAGSFVIAVFLATTPVESLVSVLLFALVGVASAGMTYLLLFSRDLKEEVLRRAKNREMRERLDRQKYYEDLGAQSED